MMERRRHKRISVNGVYGNMFRTVDNVEIINISIGGIAIRLKRKLDVGKEYTLKLKDKGKQMDIKGTVIWCDLKKDSHGNALPVYYVGIKFDDIFTSKAAPLIEFIEASITSKERLRGLRVAIKSPENVTLYDSYGYKVKLISPFGMLIETTQQINPEDKFSMELFLKDISPFQAHLHDMYKSESLVKKFIENGLVIKLLGRIVSCMEIKNSNPKSYDIGVEFLEMRAKDWAILESFIRAL